MTYNQQVTSRELCSCRQVQTWVQTSIDALLPLHAWDGSAACNELLEDSASSVYPSQQPRRFDTCDLHTAMSAFV